MSAWIAFNEMLRPLLEAVFHPINSALAPIYQPWAKVCAIGFFVGTMIWVFVGLRREYVNVQAPSRKLWHDLRIWTIVSMLPHIVVYLSF
jgi:hypothetical protein